MLASRAQRRTGRRFIALVAFALAACEPNVCPTPVCVPQAMLALDTPLLNRTTACTWAVYYSAIVPAFTRMAVTIEAQEPNSDVFADFMPAPTTDMDASADVDASVACPARPPCGPIPFSCGTGSVQQLALPYIPTPATYVIRVVTPVPPTTAPRYGQFKITLKRTM